jgi:hypothetical protein
MNRAITLQRPHISHSRSHHYCLRRVFKRIVVAWNTTIRAVSFWITITARSRVNRRREFVNAENFIWILTMISRGDGPLEPTSWYVPNARMKWSSNGPWGDYCIHHTASLFAYTALYSSLTTYPT